MQRKICGFFFLETLKNCIVNENILPAYMIPMRLFFQFSKIGSGDLLPLPLVMRLVLCEKVVLK